MTLLRLATLNQEFGRNDQWTGIETDHVQGRSPTALNMFVWFETAVAVAFALAILGYAGEIVFAVMAVVAILLIGLIGGASLFALPVKGWESPAIVTADIMIVAALRSWRRNIRELRAKGDHAWRVILIGPAVTLLLAASAAGLASR